MAMIVTTTMTTSGGEYPIGGVIESEVLNSGGGYDIQSDVEDADGLLRPPGDNSDYRRTLSFRLYTEVVTSPIPPTNTYRGNPPRRDLGLITMSHGPITSPGIWINYPLQDIGLYHLSDASSPGIPWAFTNGTNDGPGTLPFAHPNRMRFPQRASAAFWYSDYPISIRVKGAFRVSYMAFSTDPSSGRIFSTSALPDWTVDI